MHTLDLYENYSREEVHGIFSPDTVFVPRTGSWGLHGIVAIPDRPDDFVFFVTFGKSQGEFEFDEGVTKDGVLTWQSQPRMGLDNNRIHQFIDHDELNNSIYLFLRAHKVSNYTFLGKLKYLSHDTEREHPVHFQWQILDWTPSDDLLSQIGLTLQQKTKGNEKARKKTIIRRGLQKKEPPKVKPKSGKITKDFKSRKSPDYSAQDEKNRKLGLAGEKLVLAYEKQRLTNAGHTDLADKVRHVALVEGDGAGYDIKSYEYDGAVKYIEVKTTRGPERTPFFMSANEVAASKQHEDSYSLYRVYEFDKDTDSGSFYETRGDVNSQYEMRPIQFRVSGPVTKE